ncbi:MAG TPA: ATP-binding protein, partial [Acidimicrobiales bacterium]
MTGDSGGPGVVGKVREWLPTGNMLDPETFHRRHLFICWVLGLHIPALFVFGLVQGFDVADVALEMVTPTASLVLARTVRNRRLAAFFSTAGLVFCSSVLVHLSGGMIESHFHFFILIGVIALYQDWVPFAWNAVFTTVSHGLGSVMSPESMFNHYAGQNRPWLWATIHGVSVLAGCVGVVVFWKSTETAQARSNQLMADLSAAEIAAAQAEARQRQAMSDLLVNLARRNQSLLNRQLSLIAELEQREREPEALSDLFQLDHLATRIRRNAESLLVLSGDDPPRLWGRPMPLSEVVRAAAAEVEDYGRVDVLVNDHVEVTGRAVADLAHLLAELIENATTFSPPGSEVRVRSHVSPSSWSSCVVSIEDTGIGMSEADIETANQMLIEPREVDMRRSTLGFHVVSRLAKRYGIEVKVAPTPGGGLTALVTLPSEIVAESAAAPPKPAAEARARAAIAAAPVALPAGPPMDPAAATAPGMPAPVALPAAPPTAEPAPAPAPAAAASRTSSLPPLARRRPVAPVAASLSGPPMSTAAAAAAPTALTPGQAGSPAAFRSP